MPVTQALAGMVDSVNLSTIFTDVGALLDILDRTVNQFNVHWTWYLVLDISHHLITLAIIPVVFSVTL
jgi:hypothetical protein